MELISFLIGGALVLALLILLPYWNNSEIARRVNKIQGPPSVPFIGAVLPLFFLKRNELFKFFIFIDQWYKPMFRTWNGSQPFVHLMRPEDVEVILKSSEHVDKGTTYKPLHDWLGRGLLTSTGRIWHTHRKMITPTFHFTILESFVEVFAEKSEILVEKLQTEVGSQGFDVYPYMAKCALDIICETAMGMPIHAQDSRGSEYVKAISDLTELVADRVLKPWLRVDFFFKLSSYGRKHDECCRVVHGFTDWVIKERRAQLKGVTSTPDTPSDEEFIGKKKRKAFLDLLLEARDGDVKMTDEELRDEVDTIMFGGHHTTSTSMSWTLLLLGLHPDVQEKVFEEQERIFEGKDTQLTMKDLAEMKLMERVIKESLRLYPSVPTFARRLGTDAQIGGYDVPAGCNALINTYNVHRNPEQFPNPEVFDPDNFLPERVAKRHPYAYLPFSAGPRNCIGQKFALLEEKTVLSYIIRNFKFRSLDRREDIILISEIVLKPEQGIRLVMTARKMKKEM